MLTLFYGPAGADSPGFLGRFQVDAAPLR